MLRGETGVEERCDISGKVRARVEVRSESIRHEGRTKRESASPCSIHLALT